MKRCKECAFFEHGFCKRYPRTVVYLPEKFFYECSPVKFIYPEVQEDDWCGEFREFLIPSEFDVASEIQRILKDHGEQP